MQTVGPLHESRCHGCVYSSRYNTQGHTHFPNLCGDGSSTLSADDCSVLNFSNAVKGMSTVNCVLQMSCPGCRTKLYGKVAARENATSTYQLNEDFYPGSLSV